MFYDKFVVFGMGPVIYCNILFLYNKYMALRPRDRDGPYINSIYV